MILPIEATIDSLVLAQVYDVRRFWPTETTIGLIGFCPSWQLSFVLPMKATIDSLVLARVDDIRWFWPMEAKIDLLDFAHVARLRFY